MAEYTEDLFEGGASAESGREDYYFNMNFGQEDFIYQVPVGYKAGFGE